MSAPAPVAGRRRRLAAALDAAVFVAGCGVKAPPRPPLPPNPAAGAPAGTSGTTGAAAPAPEQPSPGCADCETPKSQPR